MNWLITYRMAEGNVKKVPVHAIKLPNHKAVAEHVLMDAYDNQPPMPLGNLSSIEWLERCNVEIIDIDLLTAPKLPRLR
ncbi:hypothetical protein [Pseudomonas sp. ML96]|uniref:hypothetical protein n=1 Tax=Pseudomonas sp. ML96 TaxID=1523503 RepID=UPI0005B9A25C|nr:hypothetical protein [Pseudomonas sp. ML96]